MKIEEGKILINEKISDLENIVKEELRDTKTDYFKKQILPKTISALTIIFGETKILTSGFSFDEKSVLQMSFAFYCFAIILINAFFHEDYYFLSSNKDTLERVKRIKKYIDNNINILENVDVKDFEYFINNINDNLQLRKTKKLNNK